MAQHDYDIANQGASAARTDINNALAAIQSSNSGTSAPSGPVRGQFWYDTSAAVTDRELKIYDGAGWLTICYVNETADELTFVADNIRQVGSGEIRVLDNSGTRILDLEEATQAQAESGTNQYKVMTPRRVQNALDNAPAGWVFVENLTVSGTAAETAAFTSGYSYKIVFTELSHDSGSDRYFYYRVKENDDTYHTLATDSISGGNMSAASVLNGYIMLDNPQESADIHLIETLTTVQSSAIAGTDATSSVEGSQGSRGVASVGFAAASTIKAISIEPSGGNMDSGTIRVYRRKISVS